MKKIVFVCMLLFYSLLTYGQVKQTSANVNLRTTPDISENVICTVPKGTIINIISDSNDFDSWTKISYNGKTGYINNNYIIDKSEGQNHKYYINSDGEKVQSPTRYETTPAGATAICNDGTYSFNQNRKVTCSHHGGVKNNCNSMYIK